MSSIRWSNVRSLGVFVHNSERHTRRRRYLECCFGIRLIVVVRDIVCDPGDALATVAPQQVVGIIVFGARGLDVDDGEPGMFHRLRHHGGHARAAQEHNESGRTWLDIVEAMYETPMLRYIWNGLSFSSALPNGVELVTTPNSVVGEL